jgi:hypothetical protein
MEVLDYVGVAPCGCVKVWMSATLPAKELAKEAAKAIRAGLDLRRMTTADARKALMGCAVCRPVKAGSLFPA